MIVIVMTGFWLFQALKRLCVYLSIVCRNIVLICMYGIKEGTSFSKCMFLQ